MTAQSVAIARREVGNQRAGPCGDRSNLWFHVFAASSVRRRDGCPALGPIPFGSGPGTKSYFVSVLLEICFLQHQAAPRCTHEEASLSFAGPCARYRVLDRDSCRRWGLFDRIARSAYLFVGRQLILQGGNLFNRILMRSTRMNALSEEFLMPLKEDVPGG